MRTALILSFAAAALAATPSLAQVTSPRIQPGLQPSVGQIGPTASDIHRYEMDRLRAQADRNENLARSNTMGTRLTLQELQARRGTTPTQPDVTAPRSVEEQRRRRQADAALTQGVAQDVGQIDTWLNQKPNP